MIVVWVSIVASSCVQEMRRETRNELMNSNDILCRQKQRTLYSFQFILASYVNVFFLLSVRILNVLDKKLHEHASQCI